MQRCIAAYSIVVLEEGQEKVEIEDSSTPPRGCHALRGRLVTQSVTVTRMRGSAVIDVMARSRRKNGESQQTKARRCPTPSPPHTRLTHNVRYTRCPQGCALLLQAFYLVGYP